MTRHTDNKKRILGALLLVAGWLASPSLLAKESIESVRLHRAPDHTRIVFDLPAPLDHKLDKLANPDRIVLDLQDAKLDFDINSLDYASSPIANIRVGEHADKTRVVFDMREGVRTRTNLLKPIEPHGWRLVVDLFDRALTDSTATTTGSAATSPSSKPSKAPEVRKTTQDEQRLMIVAIDAGHGGEDPGARGPSGTWEKNVVLQIAKKLQKLVNDQAGMRAVMVRDGDYYVPLAERRKIARQKHRADVFISIHADAFNDARAHGASVFALSNRGATSAKARFLAKIANESDRVAGVYEEEEDDSSLLSVLADLQMNGSMAGSLYLGRQVLKEMGKVTKLHGNREKVEQAGFAVLKEPEMVSILVETGFISNPTEERNLRSSAHQTKLAKAVLAGIDDYFRSHPAPNSWYAAQRRERGEEYRIQPGDTLSEIARQYSVSEQSIRTANDIRGDRIMVGQVLKIPRS
ncbi:N-acetylmuramoyl-L-alanine amidase [Alcanivorax sp. S6407]|uniref:N-acetylmuramoyl-L-alanine amidase n=1 Tax=Alcanivorax sp. S6407 TaxID=2926424 RepID=UPI001FF63508|nr:N-acetylmuramoyl-L-alanine amidase [Alcanivorax sp. S6407]MCK0153545.1 N-acetylmuramoyl-L-alanine amidase [Alcanivorax sp. S6407]